MNQYVKQHAKMSVRYKRHLKRATIKRWKRQCHKAARQSAKKLCK